MIHRDIILSTIVTDKGTNSQDQDKRRRERRIYNQPYNYNEWHYAKYTPYLTIKRFKINISQNLYIAHRDKGSWIDGNIFEGYSRQNIRTPT